MRTVDVIAQDPARLAAVLDEVSARRLDDGVSRARRVLAGRRLWHVSATGTGGVGELLRSLVPYSAGAGLDVGWAVLDGDGAFVELTTRLTHALHGHGEDDGGALGAGEQVHYERTLGREAVELVEHVGPGDVVLLHDPATAGLVAPLRRRGARVVWRSHVGADVPDERTEQGWAFLEPFLDGVERVVLSRAAYRPGFLDPGLVRVIAPSIDPLTAKNRELSDAEVGDLLRATGIAGNGAAGRPDGDGGPVVAGGPVPADARVVLQLSRWDRLKDLTGVLIAFAESFDELPAGTHLVLAGAEVDERDAAGARTLSDCLAMYHGLDEAVRGHAHILCLPDRSAEDALLVNAVQRRATVVVQKSLAEGFGLTVTEALWKGRPVVASAVGGIQDQITDGVNGLLLPGPTDLQGLMARVGRLLGEPVLAASLGAAAREGVRREYLSDRHLLQHVDLLEELVG